MSVTAVRRTLRSLLLWMTLAGLVLIPQALRAQAPGKRRVSGSLVYWDQERGFRAILAHADSLTEISPFWYHVTADGTIRPYETAPGTSCEDPLILAFLRGHQIRVIPTIANIEAGVWHGAEVAALLEDGDRVARHVRALVDLAVSRGYDGLDIDYEDLPAAARVPFTRFVEQLAAALHEQGKVLTVDVYGKTAEPGNWAGPQAQDWRALGAAADEVRLMTYEYHWSASAPGPVAPIAWVQEVLAFAREVIPPQKVMHGVPLYGYDWAGRAGTARVWDEAIATQDARGAGTNWDAASATPWFEYDADGERHTVWFENVMSVEAKLRAAIAQQAGGIMLWRLAGEDPAIWPAIRAYAGSATPTE